ncbi:MAG: polyhydroxyalkanoic acid synthase [Burkholderiales bacterium]|nr:polyhydroxyalkanoic acid synthase [Burkholderiales bacterium]
MGLPPIARLAEQHRPGELDRALHIRLARLTQGLSPAAISGAYMDWLRHLALSPDKQQELWSKAVQKSVRIGLHALQSATSYRCDPCIEPLPQDKRFAAPEWQQWPFNLIYQSFLLNQQWWHGATTGVSGVTRHHEEVTTFYTRQLLDMFSPSNFIFANPEVLAETAKEGGANLLRGWQKWIADMVQFNSNEPPVGTENFRPGHEVAITPGKVVFRNHLIELIQYRPQTETVFAEPVLIVPSWIMKYYILDLSPVNSLVRYLVEHGHTVFIMSWKNPDANDRDLGMDDYLQAGVMAAIGAVSSIASDRKIQALGYCLGGTLLAIAAAFMARSRDDRLQSMSLLASLLDFTEPGELGLFIDESQLAFLDNIMSKKGYLDGKQMAGAFALLNSRDLVWSRIVRDYLMGGSQRVSDLAAWNADATRMPRRQHSEYLHSLYLRNDLAEGRYVVGDKPVALTDIRIPIFSLGTQRDTVSPWRSVYKVNLLTDTDVTFCLTSGGHNVGVVNPPGPGVPRSYQLATRAADGRYVDPDTWQATAPAHQGSWWPALEGWLRDHASKRVASPAIGNKARGYPVLDDAPGTYVLTP